MHSLIFYHILRDCPLVTALWWGIVVIFVVHVVIIIIFIIANHKNHAFHSNRAIKHEDIAISNDLNTALWQAQVILWWLLRLLLSSCHVGYYYCLPKWHHITQCNNAVIISVIMKNYYDITQQGGDCELFWRKYSLFSVFVIIIIIIIITIVIFS